MAAPDQIALVVGCAGAPGAAIAAMLAGRDRRVALADPDHGAAVRLARSLGGDRAVVVDADLGDAAALVAAGARHGAVTGLFDLDRRIAWDSVARPDAFAANQQDWLAAPAARLAAFAAALPSGRGGVAVLLCDGRFEARLAEPLSYIVVQQGVAALVRSAATALAPRIRVHAVGPGEAVPRPPAGTAGLGIDDRVAAGLARAAGFCLDAGAVTGQTVLVQR